MAKTPRDIFRQRLAEVRRHLRPLGVHALLVTFLPHIRYLTGFSGSNACCVVAANGALLVTDGRYRTQVRQEVQACRTSVASGSLFEELKQRKTFQRGMRVGFDSTVLRVGELRALKSHFPSVRFHPVRNVLSDLAAVKQETEIALIRRAVEISDAVFRSVLSVIRPGVTELAVAAEIVYQHRVLGAEADAFEPIVASGTRSALPHARATGRRIAKGDLVTLDFGCRLQGYHSDMTRTVAAGRPGPKQRRIYDVVRDAQQQAVDAARAGMTGADLDAVARKLIARAGFGRFFPHSLGHGLGLQVHEAPRLSALSTDVLQPGHVVTIEPGVYVPGVGGVRIEDDVVIRNGYADVLSTSPKDLIIL